METTNTTQVVEQAESLIREYSPRHVSDPTVVHMVAVALLRGESDGLQRGSDLAVQAMRDTLLGKIDAALTGGND